MGKELNKKPNGSVMLWGHFSALFGSFCPIKVRDHCKSKYKVIMNGSQCQNPHDLRDHWILCLGRH